MLKLNEADGSSVVYSLLFLSCADLMWLGQRGLSSDHLAVMLFLPAGPVRNRCSSLVCGGEKVGVDVDVGARIRYIKSSLRGREKAAAASSGGVSFV